MSTPTNSVGFDLQTAYNTIIASEGISINPNTMMHPIDGYMVSLQGREVRIGLSTFSPQWLDHFIQRNRDAMEDHDYYLGGWADGDYVYLDVSECVHSLEMATNLARQRNQLAIYDVSCGVDIQVAK